MHKLKGNKTVDCLVRSRVPMYEYHFKWILENYSRIKNDHWFSSPRFSLEANCSWWVKLYKWDAGMKLMLYRNIGYGEIQMQCEVTVAGTNGKIWNNSNVTLNFDKSTTNRSVIENIALNADDVKTTFNDIVELMIELKLYKMNINKLDSAVQYCFSSKEQFQRDLRKSLSEDLVKFYEGHLNTDTVLSIEGETLDVHRAILSARSTVFAKMFQQEMTESTHNNVIIQDVTMAAMKEVVSFIYGKAKRDYSYETAAELYYAADKYDIMKLRDICGGILVSQLNEENAGHILTMAHNHRDFDLKEKLLKFITFNMKSCVKTEWWSNLMTIRNELTAELLEFIADFKIKLSVIND